jgi:Carboxypeptidase regulatory-like domain/TonB-dependent Receptor Plug Domain
VKHRTKVIGKFILRLKCLFLLVLCLVIPAIAQVGTANVLGVVQDSSNASIRNASVKLINIQTGTENDSKTNSDGGFLMPGVIPGAYTLQIEREGFATTQLNGITLNVGDTKNLLIRMKIGSVAESVTVDASGLSVNTSDASVSTVVDRKFVGNIPLNGRSFQDLISMTPGIVTQSPQAAGHGSAAQGDFSVDGQRPESNSFFVDGVSANMNSVLASGNSRLASTGSAAGATALGTTQSLVSIDALQEFRVLSSTYSAEYGRTPGGQFTFLTRSGTDAIHGSLYDYFRNSHFDATDWFTSSTYRPDPAIYSQNDFGGTLGAPIVLPGAYNGRDKTFFFLSYEGLYLAQPTPQTDDQYAPSGETRLAAPSALQPVLSTFPDAGFQEIVDASGKSTGLSSILFDAYSLRSHVDSTSIRVDHNFSPKLSIFFRYGNTPSYSQTRQLWSLTSNQVNTQTLTLGATTQISTSWSNEFRLGYAGSGSSLDTKTDSSPYTYVPPPNLNTALGIPGSFVSASAEAYIHIPGAGDSESNTDHATSSFGQWNVRDTFSVQVANHLFKLGFDQRHIASTVNPAALSVEADFFSRQSMVENLASDIVITKSEPASPVLNEFSAFAQDEWRMAKALTLSLGLRWEVNPPPQGQQGKDAYTALGDIDSPATLKLEPRGTPLWHTSWYNLAPRLGAAWVANAEPGKELVVRAGGGVFFDTENQPAITAFNGVGFTTTIYLDDAPVPVIPAQLDFSTVSVPPYTNTTVFAFPTHLQLPYSVQWNVGVEKAIRKDQTVTLSYVGASGHRLLQEQRSTVSRFNPNFGDVAYFPGGLTSSYQALQAKFQRSISHGVQALASYTWAHSLDYGSTDPAYPLTRGNSDLDVRHNLEVAVTWDVRKPAENTFLRHVLGNWGVDGRLIARTGFPVTLLGNLFSDPLTGSKYYSSVNLIPDRPMYLYGSEFPGGRMLNGGPNAVNPAFSLPDATDYGNAPRNSLRGFDAVQMNVAARREIHLYDRLNMQFRAETFNILNHPNFGYIDPALTDALFGQSTKILNQSFGATGSLYQQGGPRSLQFELRLTF